MNHDPGPVPAPAAGIYASDPGLHQICEVIPTAGELAVGPEHPIGNFIAHLHHVWHQPFALERVAFAGLDGGSPMLVESEVQKRLMRIIEESASAPSDGSSELDALLAVYALHEEIWRYSILQCMENVQKLLREYLSEWDSEKRLARILMLMAEFSKPGEPETFIPPITQETQAELVGTTRSRVSLFMNRFRTLGLIDYNNNGRIQVHKSLLNVVLLDQLPEHNAEKPQLPSVA
jgi:hypothetical protein